MFPGLLTYDPEEPNRNFNDRSAAQSRRNAGDEAAKRATMDQATSDQPRKVEVIEPLDESTAEEPCPAPEPVGEATFPPDSDSDSGSENKSDGSSSWSSSIDAQGAKGPTVGRDVGRDLYQFVFNTPILRDLIEQAHGLKTPVPLVELTVDLPPNKSDLSWIDANVVENYYEALKTEHLLFIICPDKQIARASAWSIVKRVDLADEQNRLLDFGRIARERSAPDFFFLRKPADPKETDKELQQLIIVVDAIDTLPEAQEFLAKIVTKTPDDITHQLRCNQISMICLADSENIQARLKTTVEEQTYQEELRFPDWQVPFLRAVLKPHFEDGYLELEQKILSRRSTWDPSDKIFVARIRELVKTGSLLARLESPEPVTEPPVGETVFRGDDPILDTVIYAATYFPGLTLREFQQIVTVLLADKTKTVTASVLKEKEDGSSERVEIEYEKPLIEIWRESMDQIKRQCLLVTMSGPEATRTIDFRDHRMRARLKLHLIEEYPFFIASQTDRLLEAGLLFDPSPQIGENMIELIAEVTATDSDYYVNGWLVKIITDFEEGMNPANHRDIPLSPVFQTLAGIDLSQVDHHVYKRITNLIRTLLEKHGLTDAVDNLLEQLIHEKRYDSILKIVRRLRFARGFDEFYWLKQLFDRGHKVASSDNFAYLYKYLRSSGGRIYELLASLDSWLFRAGQIPQFPSTSGKEALRLMFVYCIESTAGIGPDNYGVWPSTHPLFTFKDIESARTNLKLLLRWLFHPWMKSVFSDKGAVNGIDELIAELTSQWVFLLIGPLGRLSGSTQDGLPDSPPKAREVERIFAEQLVESTNSEQQSNLLAIWRASSRDVIAQIKELPYGTEGRQELIWKRNLLDDFITQIRDLVEAQQKSKRTGVT
jgi:hypothetical protein